MLRFKSYLLLTLVLLPLLVSTARGDEETDKPQATDSETPTKDAEGKSQEEEPKAEKPKRDTHRVERKPLKIDVELDGTFVALEQEEVALRPEVWKEFTVIEAVQHGARVNKGDVLVRFDSEEIERKVARDTISQRINELALLELEEDQPRQQRLLEIAYEKARLAHEQLVEDVAYYKETDRPMKVRMANHRLESSKEDLASQEEELAQLEKMYAADDLTEETEQIVLRRQKFQVQSAKFYLERQQLSHDQTLDVTLPRSDESYARQLKQAKLKLEQAKTAKEMGVTRGKYRLEERRTIRAQNTLLHAKLLGDRALMEIRAPRDGIVYYGSFRQGDLSGVASLEEKLKPHGSVSPGTVLMTIVEPRPLRVHAKVEEEDLPGLKEGLTAQVVPTADDDLEFPAKVAKLSAVPNAKTEFPLELSLGAEDLPEWLAAGMTCEAKITIYENDQALVIPSDMVKTDEADKESHYVMVVKSGSEPERRNVELGRSDGKVIEVLNGLAEGDEIVKEKKTKEDS